MSYVAISKCFFCGKDKNQIVLDKRMRDVFPTSSVVTDFEPCDECKAKFSIGVTAFGVQPYMPLVHGKIAKSVLIKSGESLFVPTGKYIVLNEDSHIVKHFSEITKSPLKKGSRVLVDDEIIDKIVANAPKEGSD